MNMKKKGAIAALLGGAAIGAGLGVLFAPQSGEKTRKELKIKIDELVGKAKEVKMEDVKEYVSKKTEEIENALKDLDKETVLKFAKEKANDVQQKAKDLVKYVKEKGTPVLEDAANGVRDKAIEVTKTVLKKLEDSKKEK